MERHFSRTILMGILLFSWCVAWGASIDDLPPDLQAALLAQQSGATAAPPSGAQSPQVSGSLSPQVSGAGPLPPGLPPPPALAGPSLSPGERAFSDMTSTLLPMSPEQIMRLKQMFDATQAAAAAPPGVPPKPSATTQNVNLAPGTTPPVIRLSQGFVTSVVFLDSTGAPWPIEAYDLGNPQAFNVQWNQKDNTLMVQATTAHTYGNVAVRLRGLSTPVMLTLLPGQQSVDYRVDLRIQGLGPEAKLSPLADGLPEPAHPTLLAFLDNVPPPGARNLTVMGGEAQAWVIGDRMYLRTACNVLSPGWMATVSSGDGMHVYEMAKSPVVLASRHGEMLTLKVDGF